MSFAEGREFGERGIDYTGRPRRTRPDVTGSLRPPCWLVIKRASSGMEVLTIELAGGEEALPIFSFRKEATAFLRSCYGDSGGGVWWIRKTGAGELLSLLTTRHDVGKVALDPLPEAVSNPAMDLFCVGRSTWMDLLAGRGRSWF